MHARCTAHRRGEAYSIAGILYLLKTDRLRIWHLYLVNVVSGLMNTIQQPASEVAVTAILPRKHYQKVGSLRYLSSSVNSILTPIIATTVLGLGGMDAVMLIDLASFAAAFLVLLFFVPIPNTSAEPSEKQSLLRSAWDGVRWLQRNLGVFHLILFLAAINLVASMYNAAFPAMMLSKPNAGELTMGIVNTVIGVTSLVGSLLASFMKAPKSRARAIWISLMLSMSTENFFLAFGQSPVGLVPRRVSWLDCDPVDERKYGGDSAPDHPGGDSGACVCGTEFL